jgi:hypothetical protein
MTEFKISPVTQCKTRSNRSFLSWFLSLIMIIETISFGYWIFRLNAQIAELERRIEIIQANEKGESTNVRQ